MTTHLRSYMYYISHYQSVLYKTLFERVDICYHAVSQDKHWVWATSVCIYLSQPLGQNQRLTCSLVRL